MRFGLITNRQWQLLAWSIELNGENWSSGEVGEGCLKQGNTGIKNACGYDGENPEKGCSHKKARHRLLNGPAEEFVCHVGGNVSEWVFDVGDNSFLQGNNQYMNNYSGTDYGPLGNYSCDDSSNPMGCGLGYGYLQGSAGAVLRGGVWNDGSSAGVFTADLSNSPLYSNHGVGFRCTLSLLTESNSSTEESGFE